MTEWIVKRWTRYGHDRLYIAAPDGTALGYRDLKTGSLYCDDSSNLSILQEALAESDAMLNAAFAVSPAADAAVNDPSIATAGPSVPDWDDLSLNQPGVAARRRALTERAKAPVRTFLARLLGVRTDERDWRIGADGEEAVAAKLSKLGAAWRVLHAIEIGERGADIDHLVIGPGGVFTVNAKHHPNANVWVANDTFMVNGQRVDHVRNSRYEARRVARLLTQHVGFPLTATGVIAVMGAQRGFDIKEQPRDGAVVIVKRKRIRQHLQSLPTILSDSEIAAIYEIARRSTTWH